TSWRQVEGMLAQAQAGDTEAENALFAYVRQRFEAIAVHMFRTRNDPAFSGSDVMQNLCLRLLETLREQRLNFHSARHFLAVAAKNLRWAALELLRRPALRHWDSVAERDQDTAGSRPQPVASTSSSPERWEAWQRFHELIDQPGVLEEEEREVVNLRWYHGLTQEEIARILQVSERTVKRYWHSAKEKLRRYLDLDDLK
ncbi:MAG: sigma-70 family RNA polymerase sigma factor, partial [Gemmatales bacterium]|nr:sigma-70 family RNA polymerase sigma factor [Gemmatales bacterium]